MTTVTVTRDVRVNFNYQVWELTAGQTVSGDLAVHLLDAGYGVEEEPAVPDGTVAGVTDWVGGDPVRAAAALAAERGRDKPRSTLVADLEKLAGGEPDEE